MGLKRIDVEVKQYSKKKNLYDRKKLIKTISLSEMIMLDEKQLFDLEVCAVAKDQEVSDELIEIYFDYKDGFLNEKELIYNSFQNDMSKKILEEDKLIEEFKEEIYKKMK